MQVLSSILTPAYGKSFDFSCLILLSLEKFDVVALLQTYFEMNIILKEKLGISLRAMLSWVIA